MKQQMVEERNILKVELLDVKSSLVGKFERMAYEDRFGEEFVVVTFVNATSILKKRRGRLQHLTLTLYSCSSR